MLFFLVLLVMSILALASCITLGMNRASFNQHSVSTFQLRTLQIFVLLYVASLIAFAFPTTRLSYFSLAAFCFLPLLPGIIFGRRLASKLDVGYDSATKAFRSASNASWLGITALIFFAFNIALSVAINGIGSGLGG